jgi:hypothetical protein
MFTRRNETRMTRRTPARTVVLSAAAGAASLLLLSVSPACAASPTAAAAAPPAPAASAHAAPAATPPVLDQSSPKAQLRSFFASRGELDEAAIRSLYHATTPVEQKILDGVVQVELANARLRAAEKEKFGKPTTRPSGPSVSPLDPGALGQLDSFVEKIEGDKATVSAPKVPGMSMEFVRVDGKWKLPIASLVGKLDPAMADTMDASTRAQVAVIDSITADVRSGKLTTEAQVREQMKKRLADRLAAATRNAPAATTAPAVPSKT